MPACVAVGYIRVTRREVRILTGRFYDSVKLLRVSERLQGLPGVISASAMMASPMNIELLATEGFAVQLGDAVRAEDVVVALDLAGDTDPEAVLRELELLLAPITQASGPERAPRTIEAALNILSDPGDTIAVIAVAGEYAAAEAWVALHHDLDVFLFSDNVPVEAEIRLKRFAAAAGRLVMGPDCGTSIIDGIGYGFANHVRPGSVGLTGGSGTGIQQVSCLIDSFGQGVAAAIGAGSRDLSAEVDGIMTMAAIDRLAAMDEVRIIGLVSKAGSPEVAHRVLEKLAVCGKPAVACLLGPGAQSVAGVATAATLEAAAAILVGRDAPVWDAEPSITSPQLTAVSSDTRPKRRLVGLYCGGTLCLEAQLLSSRVGAISTRLVDVGADEYTRGRAHPMIDSRLRAAMIAEAGHDADVLLLDVILGELADADPAGAVIGPLADAAAHALDRGVRLQVFAALIGVEGDPQGFTDQLGKLREAGVNVSRSNAEATRLAITAAVGEAAAGMVGE